MDALDESRGLSAKKEIPGQRKLGVFDRELFPGARPLPRVTGRGSFDEEGIAGRDVQSLVERRFVGKNKAVRPKGLGPLFCSNS